MRAGESGVWAVGRVSVRIGGGVVRGRVDAKIGDLGGKSGSLARNCRGKWKVGREAGKVGSEVGRVENKDWRYF